ncbi:MAG: carboxypeptidase-like regulatory domain-containing protein [Methylococcales bacterium]
MSRKHLIMGKGTVVDARERPPPRRLCSLVLGVVALLGVLSVPGVVFSVVEVVPNKPGTSRIINPVPSISSVTITGRVVDAQTGLPLRGDEFPFAFVKLNSDDCFPGVGCQNISTQATDNLGRFDFTQGIEPGIYHVVVSANQYHARFLDLGADEGENVDLGDIDLVPLPLQFTDIVPCTDVPAQGGQCLYSVRVTNKRTTKLKNGRVWSIVTGYSPGYFVAGPVTTVFQKGKRDLTLKAAQSTVVKFGFKVPESLLEGSFICADAWAGSDNTNPYLGPLSNTFLFCIKKTGNTGVSARSGSGNGRGGFEIMPMKEAYELYLQRQGHGIIPLDKRP